MRSVDPRTRFAFGALWISVMMLVVGVTPASGQTPDERVAALKAGGSRPLFSSRSRLGSWEESLTSFPGGRLPRFWGQS